MLQNWKFFADFYVTIYADDPNNDPVVSGDPYKTLFVARLVSSTSPLH